MDALWNSHPWMVVALPAAVIFWVIKTVYASRPAKLDFPVIGTPESNVQASVIEGYRKYPDSPFILPLTPPRVILPMSLFKEVSEAPRNVISFAKEMYQLAQGKYTHIGTGRLEMVYALRNDLTKNVAHTLPLISDEARFGIDAGLGDSTEWHTVPIYHKLAYTVSIMSGRIFLGRPLNRSKEWVHSSIVFAQDIGQVIGESQNWGPLLRPLIGPWSAAVRRAVAHINQSKAWTEPLMKDVFNHDGSEKEKMSELGETGSSVSLLSWMAKYLPYNERNSTRLGENQMLISFASIHTTTATMTNVLFDLLARPKYVEGLREEIRTVLAEDGEELDIDGQPYITKASFAKMKKLDSFIKESQRMEPITTAGILRELAVDYTFSNGLKLPKGTRVAFPMAGIHRDPNASMLHTESNAETDNADPEAFDGYRFARIRELPGNQQKLQAATTSQDQMNFGHGPYACPGRFFAIYELKTMLVFLLRYYDLRLPSDVKGRPTNIINGVSNMPNHLQPVEVRRRVEPIGA